MPVVKRLIVRLVDVDDVDDEITIERLSPSDERADGPLFVFSQSRDTVNLSLSDLADLIEALGELIQRNGALPEASG